MKHLMILAAPALAVFLAAPVFAQAPSMTANIPFAFSAGEKAFPAGEYQITFDLARNVSLIASPAWHNVGIFRTVPGGAGHRAVPVEKGALRFEKYGPHYVLVGLWRAGAPEGAKLLVQGAAKEYARIGVLDLPATR